MATITTTTLTYIGVKLSRVLKMLIDRFSELAKFAIGIIICWTVSRSVGRLAGLTSKWPSEAELKGASKEEEEEKV